MADLSGTTLGQYQLLEQIGGGGMATVYKAYQPAMGRFVAIKVVRGDTATDAEFRRRFNREAHTIASLEHRYILPVHDFGEDAGTPYLVMRYTTGGTLTEAIERGALPIGKAVEYVAQVAEALDYAHAKNVIHRDIKPANILLSDDGHVLLTDFGIAKMQIETTAMTSPGSLIGTPAYMAPEQVRGRAVDARTDIYALGIVLYELLTGQRPFTAETPWAVLDMQLRDPLPPPRQHNPAISEDLERIILKATAKEPAERFQTAAEMAAALRASSPGLSAPASQPGLAASQPVAPPQPASQPQPAPRAWRWIVPALLVVALAGGAGMRFLGGAAPAGSPTALAGEPTAGPQPTPAIVTAPAIAPPTQPQATPTARPEQSPPAGDLLFSDQFTDLATSAWNGEAPGWQLVKDENGRSVYQGQAPPDHAVASAPDAQLALLSATSDYAISLSFRVVQPGVAGDDYADFWLSARVSPNPSATGGCESYVFFVDSGAAEVMLSRNGIDQCDYTEFQRAPASLQPNSWHTLTAELDGSDLRLNIDGQPLATARDDRLTQGSYYLTVGHGATVQFADLAVTRLP